MRDKELEKLQKEIAERQAKIDEINAKKDKSKLKLFEVFFKENEDDKLKDLLKKSYQKLSKTDQKNLASIYDWINEPTGTPSEADNAHH